MWAGFPLSLFVVWCTCVSSCSFSHSLVLVCLLLWEVRVGMRIRRCGEGWRLPCRDVYLQCKLLFVVIPEVQFWCMVIDVPVVAQRQVQFLVHSCLHGRRGSAPRRRQRQWHAFCWFCWYDAIRAVFLLIGIMVSKYGPDGAGAAWGKMGGAVTVGYVAALPLQAIDGAALSLLLQQGGEAAEGEGVVGEAPRQGRCRTCGVARVLFVLRREEEEEEEEAPSSNLLYGDPRFCVRVGWFAGVTMLFTQCSLWSSTGPRCSASWPLGTEGLLCARRRFWQWHVQGSFCWYFTPRAVFLPWFSGPDARHHGRYEPEGQLCGEMVVVIPVVAQRLIPMVLSTTEIPQLQFLDKVIDDPAVRVVQFSPGRSARCVQRQVPW